MPSMRMIAVVSSMAVFMIAWLSYGSLGQDLDFPNEKTWAWAFYSLMISVGALATALWVGLSKQFRMYGLALLFLLTIFVTVRGSPPAIGGIASLVVLEVFAVTALATARYMDFTWNRISRVFFSILLAGGLVTVAAFPLAFVSLLAFGWGRLHSLLVPVLVVLIAVVGAGALVGLWILEGKATESRSRSSWGTAAGGFVIGVAVSYFSLAMAEFDNIPNYFGLLFCVLAAVSLSAATLAGYSLRAGNLLVGPSKSFTRSIIR